MTVANPRIDNDHKYLISLINAIEAAVNCGLDKRVLLGHIAELFAYTEEHFKKEENIQADIKFPHKETHKKEHENLVIQLNAIRANLKNPQNAEFYQSAVQSLFDTLRDWLLNHILEEDLKMREYFSKTK